MSARLSLSLVVHPGWLWSLCCSRLSSRGPYGIRRHGGSPRGATHLQVATVLLRSPKNMYL